jgi:hypothetical protein
LPTDALRILAVTNTVEILTKRTRAMHALHGY